MAHEDFSASLSAAMPPSDLSAALVALWWIYRGDWDRAHGIAQDAPGAEAAWVHAHLHRVEGDLGNADYWYRRAGRPAARGNLAEERAAMVVALLGAA